MARYIVTVLREIEVESDTSAEAILNVVQYLRSGVPGPHITDRFHRSIEVIGARQTLDIHVQPNRQKI